MWGRKAQRINGSGVIRADDVSVFPATSHFYSDSLESAWVELLLRAGKSSWLVRSIVQCCSMMLHIKHKRRVRQADRRQAINTSYVTVIIQCSISSFKPFPDQDKDEIETKVFGTISLSGFLYWSVSPFFTVTHSLIGWWESAHLYSQTSEGVYAKSNLLSQQEWRARASPQSSYSCVPLSSVKPACSWPLL